MAYGLGWIKNFQSGCVIRSVWDRVGSPLDICVVRLHGDLMFFEITIDTFEDEDMFKGGRM